MRSTIISFLLVLLLFPSITFCVELSPEDVYAEFHKATLNTDIESLKKYGTSERGKGLSENPSGLEKAMLAMMAKITPKTYEILKKEVNNETAKLFLVSEKDGKTIEGSALLVVENGSWKVDEVDWNAAAGEKSIEFDPFTGEIKEKEEKPTAPASEGNAIGKINGLDFIVESAELKSRKLVLKQGADFFADREIVIFLMSKYDQLMKEGKLIIKSGNFGVPHIHMKYKLDENSVPKAKIFTNRYSMTLELQDKHGVIDLRLPDSKKSFVSGTFTLR